MCENQSDALLQLELDLYRGQAQVLAKRVCELELRRQGPEGIGAGSHSNYEGLYETRCLREIEGSPTLFETASGGESSCIDKSFARKEEDALFCPEDEFKGGLHAQLNHKRQTITELRAEIDLLRAAALDPERIPPYVRDLCRELANEREERNKCLRIVRDLSQAAAKDCGEADGTSNEEWSLGMLDRSSSVEVVLQRRVASLCRAQRRLRGENADLARRLRAAASDAADAAAAADNLRQQLELAGDWRALRRRSDAAASRIGGFSPSSPALAPPPTPAAPAARASPEMRCRSGAAETAAATAAECGRGRHNGARDGAGEVCRTSRGPQIRILAQC
jgi:hypothetical protein